MTLDIMIMSGVEDGLVISLNDESDGRRHDGEWTLSIGRHDDSDIALRNDTFISREHARIHWRHNRWWLQDCDSKNGSFIETEDDDLRIRGTVSLERGQLFRIGRTWLRLQPSE